ncbi:hypothetical protein CWS43_27065 [Rahnella sp. AA]|nr:hypothetical protein CWS43_27065 [Rahnella sp. AA]
MRNDGFVKNINSANEYDVISAKVVIDRLSQRANRGCSLYFEIFERNFLSMALSYVDQLPLSHRPAFFDAASEAGFVLSLDEYRNSLRAYYELMDELRDDY